ncbi:MAG: NAD(P)H-dependent oxidoreductase [Steroidobacteraceae bacterium]
MDHFSIALVVGSLRRESFNRRLAEAMTRLAPPDLAFHELPIGQLPLYNQDEDDHPGEAVRHFKSSIESSRGLLFVTPEYNRSVPGVLKNALDHASRPYGRNSWAGKPAGILGVSIGAVGTAAAQQHLRNILAYLDVPTLAQPEAFIQMKDSLFDAKENIGADSHKFLQGWMDRYAAWVRQHAAPSG